MDCNCRTPMGGNTSAGCTGDSMEHGGGEVAHTAVKAFHGRAVMHNFGGTTFVHDASVLITVGKRALHNSQHRLLCGTGIVQKSALREHFQRSEGCNGSEQRSCT